MRCGQCDKTTKVSFSPLPAKVKCSIDNQFHEMSEQCKIEFVPLKHGRWIDSASEDCYRCSVCEEYAHMEMPRLLYHYCPNCGAKMREVEEYERRENI